jgi:hypothetical protein
MLSTNAEHDSPAEHDPFGLSWVSLLLSTNTSTNTSLGFSPETNAEHDSPGPQLVSRCWAMLGYAGLCWAMLGCPGPDLSEAGEGGLGIVAGEGNRLQEAVLHLRAESFRVIPSHSESFRVISVRFQDGSAPGG